jgi:CDP-L-myo-inositol myo-inositolphosphotransferase
MKLPLGVIVFASGRDAERLVAGVPAAARSVREARRAGLSVCWVTAGAGWEPSAATRAEIDRLADGMDVHFGNGSALAVEGGFDRVAMIPGDRQPTADAILRAIAEPDGITQADLVQVVPQEEANQVAGRMTAQGAESPRRLGAAARAVVRSTLVLHFPGIRPVHATIGTGLIAAAMFASLLFWGATGLVVGAILFQAASIFDGVDGEISRATFRSSPAGAKMDSLVDAATNLAFLLGVAINLQVRGEVVYATFGYAGLVLLARGLVMIGRAAARSQAPFSFDVVKDHYRRQGANGEPSRLMQGLTYLTSRDFFALAFALLIAFGLAPLVLALFAVAAGGWLVAVILALRPTQA